MAINKYLGTIFVVWLWIKTLFVVELSQFSCDCICQAHRVVMYYHIYIAIFSGQCKWDSGEWSDDGSHNLQSLIWFQFIIYFDSKTIILFERSQNTNEWYITHPIMHVNARNSRRIRRYAWCGQTIHNLCICWMIISQKHSFTISVRSFHYNIIYCGSFVIIWIRVWTEWQKQKQLCIVVNCVTFAYCMQLVRKTEANMIETNRISIFCHHTMLAIENGCEINRWILSCSRRISSIITSYTPKKKIRQMTNESLALIMTDITHTGVCYSRFYRRCARTMIDDCPRPYYLLFELLP